jgi:hypothetical protein
MIDWKCVCFEVLTALVMKSSIFWDITPCSPLKVSDHSEEHIASIFRIEDKRRKKPMRKHVANSWLLL